jgi:hypothetical protein
MRKIARQQANTHMARQAYLAALLQRERPTIVVQEHRHPLAIDPFQKYIKVLQNAWVLGLQAERKLGNLAGGSQTGRSTAVAHQP